MSSTSNTTASTDSADHGIVPPGFRLPASTRIGVVRLQVADLDRSITYYERVLGFRTLTRTSGTAALGAIDSETPIIELHENAGARPVPKRGRLGLFHFAILLPDRPSLGRLLSHLGKIGVQAGMSDHLVSEAIYLTDPDGLGIEVYADRPRATWRYEGRQMVMATNPLGVADLIAAGGTSPWTGMPNGTTMGHVHLHVGDLDQAAAFYHDALGFDKVVWGYPGALFLSAGGYHHHLGTNTWAAGAPPAADDEARLIEWELVLPTASSVGSWCFRPLRASPTRRTASRGRVRASSDCRTVASARAIHGAPQSESESGIRVRQQQTLTFAASQAWSRVEGPDRATGIQVVSIQSSASQSQSQRESTRALVH